LANKIGRITPAGAVVEFNVPTLNAAPHGITAGPDGNVWFTEPGVDKIGRITPAGVITEFDVPMANSQPLAITSGPDGNLWFTEYSARSLFFPLYAIGKITVGGTVTEYTYTGGLSNGCGAGTAITVVPNGKIGWSTTCAGFFRATTAGTIDFAVFINAALASNFYGVATGADQNMWATQYDNSAPGSWIVRVPNGGPETQFALPDPSSWPYGVVAGLDGNLWFTEANTSRIGTITPTGTITEYPIPTTNAMPRGIAVGPDGAVWFVEGAGNKVGRLGSVAATQAVLPVPTLSVHLVFALLATLLGGGLIELARRRVEMGAPRTVWSTKRVRIRSHGVAALDDAGLRLRMHSTRPPRAAARRRWR
jgi:streptogramin lyase